MNDIIRIGDGMKKGFTLIELLAVIVVLALISVIIIPVVNNLLDNSRKKAAELSATNYIDAVKGQIALSTVSPSIVFSDGEYDVSSLKDDYGVLVDNYPTSGSVNIIDNTITNAEICINKYYVSYLNGIFRVLGKCNNN